MLLMCPGFEYQELQKEDELFSGVSDGYQFYFCVPSRESYKIYLA